MIVDLRLYEVADRDKVELAHEFLSGKRVELSPILVRAGDSLRCQCKDSMRYRLPRTAAHGFTETSNCDMNVPAGFCVRQTESGTTILQGSASLRETAGSGEYLFIE